MKYKVESDFCEDFTPILLAMFHETGRQIVCVPEVPWGFFSNEQFDMLLLDKKKLEYLCIEYKLSNLNSLKDQLHRLTTFKYMPNYGFINKPLKDTEYSISSYTGLDTEIEQIAKRIVFNKWSWRNIYHGFGMIYYWAFKDNENSFKGGILGGNRMGFATMYKQAIRNLLIAYPDIDFMLTHSALGSGYSIASSKKYFNQAKKCSLTPITGE